MSKNMVRCTFCGVIFEEGPQVCPICGVGTEYFEPVAQAPEAPAPKPERAAGRRMMRCTFCGAVFEEGPEICPICKLGAEYFEPLEDVAPKPASGKKMVRCLVCGAVFEEGTEICPVCGVGPEHFVPVEEEAQSFRRDTDLRYLVLGGGIAGLSAAEAIRARDATGRITILSDESYAPYNRPMLTKNMNAQPETLLVRDASFYEDKHILLLKDLRVASVQAEEKTVTLEDGAKLKYDRCVYALGAEAFRLPIPGSGLPGAFVLRRISDAERISKAAKPGARAIIVGGGVLGLEAACAFLEKGCAVTVLEAADRVMPRQLEKGASALLAAAAEKAGVCLKTGVVIDSVAADSGTK